MDDVMQAYYKSSKNSGPAKSKVICNKSRPMQRPLFDGLTPYMREQNARKEQEEKIKLELLDVTCAKKRRT